MASTAIVAISRRGSGLARSLATSLGGSTTLYLERRLLRDSDDAVAFDLPARPVVKQVFEKHEKLVLLMPVGAAVRLLSPYLSDKHTDPAVVCVDDAGRFAVSLLSGHLGGADQLAQEVAHALGATAVVTSASHVTGTLAVDMLGQEFGWQLEAAPLTVTRASAAVVNGDPVGIYQETGEPDWWPADLPLPQNLQAFSTLEALAAAPCRAALVITDRRAPPGSKSRTYNSALPRKFTVVYRPRSLAVGLGCRRGVPTGELEKLLDQTFRRNNLSPKSIRCIATAQLKQDEPGILSLAEKLGVPLHCYSNQELNAVFEGQPQSTESPEDWNAEDGDADGPGTRPTRSEAPHRLLGVWGVSEPAALLAAGAKELVVAKEKTSRATIAIARVSFAPV